MKRIALIVAAAMMLCGVAAAQQYNGTSGLVHIPSAEMNEAGDFRAGGHFINKRLMPDSFSYTTDGGAKEKYNSFSYYLSATIFSWVEVSYDCVAFKKSKVTDKEFTSKDRHFGLKFRPLKEGKYWPAIAVGADDILGSSLNFKNMQGYFANAWIAMAKHVDIKGHELGFHIGYRYYFKDFNSKYNKSPFGAITYRPAFAPYARAMVEWDGVHLSCGLDALLWKHLLVQVALTDGVGFSAGLAFQVNLMHWD